MSPLTSPSLSKLSPEQKKALLAQRLKQQSSESALPPLSFAQQRLWLVDQLEPGSGHYNVPTALRCRGALDRSALQSALDEILRRHEPLRTRIASDRDVPCQEIRSPEPLPIAALDLGHLPNGESESRALELLSEEARRPFDLAEDLMIRALLVRLGPEHHILLLTLHHIAADEWSLKNLHHELSRLYNAAALGRPHSLPPLLLSYADFARRQRRELRAEQILSQLGAWTRQLAGAPAHLDFPTDHRRPSTRKHRGKRAAYDIPAPLSDEVRRLARDQNATLFMILFAAFASVIARYTRQQDIVLGTPIAGRNSVEAEPLIGFFVNTLLLRVQFSDNPSFLTLLKQVRETTLNACTAQEVPFEKIVEQLHPGRTSSEMPFLQIMFALEGAAEEGVHFEGLETELLRIDNQTSKFDFTFVVKELPRGLALLVEYDADLFEPGSMQRLLAHYARFLENALRQPAAPVATLPLLTREEEDLILGQWNATQTDFPRHATLPELFEDQARRTPQAPAVRYGQRTLSYRQLDTRANQLAHFLRERGVHRGSTVGICLDRSPDLIVSLLATLKAGGAYVPLDPDYPPDRIGFMMSDAKVQLLITSAAVARSVPKTACVVFDRDRVEIEQQPVESLPLQNEPADLAYIIYTSGSTGRPKGVCVPHRAIVRLVRNTNYISIEPEDRLAQVSNASFDAATFEVWGALLNGAELVGYSKDTALNPTEFARHLAADRITILFLTTALFNQTIQEAPLAFSHLKHMLFGGENADPQWVRAALGTGAPRRLLHVYGPTETTTFATWHWVQSVREKAHSVPIGRPISNTTAYILGPALDPLPIGVPGEIYLGGDGLAHGYWNRPDLTQERFVPNPFQPGTQLYKTGDLGRFCPDGSIEFLGRFDHQVKIRGFRIELGEIEAVLNAHPAVQESVVVLNAADNDKQLIAYWVAKPDATPPELASLRRHLRERLPDYMAPAFFVRMDALPLNPNGKIDRDRLPPADRSASTSTLETVPRTSTEQKLQAVWQTTLNLQSVSVTDDFFEVGGHSLLAVRLFLQIEKVFGKKLPLSTIFAAPTIEALAQRIDEENSESSSSLLVEIQPGGAQRPFFWIHSLGGDGGGGFFYYRKLAELLGPDQPSYGIRSPHKPHTDIESMAAHYIDAVRTLQPSGPYTLGGFCFGGVVAYEMARQLLLENEEIGLLVVVESAPPNIRTPAILSPRFIKPALENVFFCLADALRTDRKALFLRLRRRMKALIPKNRSRLDPPEAPDLGEVIDLANYPKEFIPYAQAHWKALTQYRPKLFPGALTLFRCQKQPLGTFNPTLGWDQICEGVTVWKMPGSHEQMLQEPNVHLLAERLSAHLATARRSVPTPLSYAPA